MNKPVTIIRFKGEHLVELKSVEYLIRKWAWIPKFKKHDFYVVKKDGKWQLE